MMLSCCLVSQHDCWAVTLPLLAHEVAAISCGRGQGGGGWKQRLEQAHADRWWEDRGGGQPPDRVGSGVCQKGLSNGMFRRHPAAACWCRRSSQQIDAVDQCNSASPCRRTRRPAPSSPQSCLRSSGSGRRRRPPPRSWRRPWPSGWEGEGNDGENRMLNGGCGQAWMGAGRQKRSAAEHGTACAGLHWQISAHAI